MYLNDLIEKSGYQAETVTDLKRQLKEELKFLSKKDVESGLTDVEKERQLFLNQLKDQIRDSNSSDADLAKIDKKIPFDLVSIVKEMVISQKNIQNESKEVQQRAALKEDLSLFKSSAIKHYKVPKYTSTGVLGVLSTLFFLPKDFLSETIANDLFASLSSTSNISSDLLSLLWLNSLIITAIIWIVTIQSESSVNNLVQSVSSESTMANLFGRFLYIHKNEDTAFYYYKPKSDTFTTSNFVEFIIGYFKSEIMRNKYPFYLINPYLKKIIFSNPELINAIETAAKIQFQNGLDNEVISIDKKSIEIIYKITNESF